MDNTDLRMLAALRALLDRSIHQIAETAGLSSTPLLHLRRVTAANARFALGWMK